MKNAMKMNKDHDDRKKPGSSIKGHDGEKALMMKMGL